MNDVKLKRSGGEILSVFVEPDDGRQYLCSRGIPYSLEPAIITTTGIDEPCS
jgi:hypothetical protein